MGETILGIDLSLTGLGLCATPAPWAIGDWSQVRRVTLGISLTKAADARDAATRRRALAMDVCTFADRVHATHVVVEGYPVGGRVFNLDKLAELGGVVKHELLLRLNLATVAAPLVTARKLMLGWVPRGLKKGEWQKPIWDAAPAGTFQTTDEVDAFIACNWMLAELGYPCVAMPAPAQKQKPKRGRKAA